MINRRVASGEHRKKATPAVPDAPRQRHPAQPVHLFVAAQIGAEIAQRLKVPGIVSEVAAGCILGPSLLGRVQPSETLDVLAAIGGVLLFSMGLDTGIEDMHPSGAERWRSAYSASSFGSR